MAKMGKKKSAGSSSRRRTRQRTAAVDKRAIELAERMQEALNYRRLGYTYQQIS
jgi:hypothetical protein